MFLYNLLKPVREDGLLAFFPFFSFRSFPFSGTTNTDLARSLSCLSEENIGERGIGIILSVGCRESCRGRCPGLPLGRLQR